MDASKRLSIIREFMKENTLSMCIVTDVSNQYYISGFKALIYSRPIVLTIDYNETSLVIPGLEENHALHQAEIDKLFIYFEHPERANEGITYLEHLNTILSTLKEGSTLGVEFNSIPLGLADYIKNKGFKLLNISDKIKEMRYIKDEQELDLLMKSGELVSHALAESLNNAKVGMSEIELDAIGNKAFLTKVALEYPEATVAGMGMSPSGLIRTNMPHVFSNTRKFDDREIIIHSRQVGLYDYHAECERTFFIGEPSEEQKKAFIAMYESQQACLKFVKPGVTAKEVDKVGRDILIDAGYGDYAIHRIGHGIGIGSHEEPYLRFDSDLVLEEGMVFSIEPGIYIPELGGFRHSDTVILTKEGSQLITEYPRELDQLIF
jgi:Xaa-Pro dipeptidase